MLTIGSIAHNNFLNDVPGTENLGFALGAEAIVFFSHEAGIFQDIFILFFIHSLKQLKLKFAHLQKADRDEDNDPEKYFSAKFFEKKPERPSTDKLV